MAHTAPIENLPWSLMNVYVDVYDPENGTLTLNVVLAGFSPTTIDDPTGILPALQKNYEQITIGLIENYLGLQHISEGEEFPDIYGNMVVIGEEYTLVTIDGVGSDKISLAGLIDPLSEFPFRYSRVTLHYCRVIPTPLLEVPLGWKQEPLNPAWGYPSGAVNAWKLPTLGNNGWYTIIGNIYNGSPRPHIRCFCMGEWVWLLTQQEMESGDIFDCFRWSVPGDGGPWFSGMQRFISRGINDSWADSSDEIVSRRGGIFDTIGTAVHWLHTHLFWHTKRRLSRSVCQQMIPILILLAHSRPRTRPQKYVFRHVREGGISLLSLDLAGLFCHK